MRPRPWFILFPLVYMAGIFLVSSIPDAPRADETPAQLVQDWLPELLQNMLHVPLFGVLALLWGWSLRCWNTSARVESALMILFAGSYAVLDELHQSAVPGRQASFQDVLLDLAGVIIAVWLWAGWLGRRGPARAVSKERR